MNCELIVERLGLRNDEHMNGYDALISLDVNCNYFKNIFKFNLKNEIASFFYYLNI